VSWTHDFNPNAYVNERLRRAMWKWVLCYGVPMWYHADWWCAGCGRPQAGKSPWPSGVARCRACGPGEGFVPCPAGAEPGCRLCKGTGYVEELI
jgi:hypothetical protein